MTFHYLAWRQQQGRTLPKPPPDTKLEVLVNVSAGIEIAKRRLEAISKDYTPRFQLASMTTVSFLGEGSYGKVWRAKFTKTPEVAVKQLPSHKNSDELWKERDLLIKLKNPRIINLMGAFHEGDLFLVFDLCYCK